MATHRLSYWKTTAAAFAAMLTCLAALAWLLSSSPLAAPRGLLAFALGASAFACLMIGCGGLICLWQDAREAAGKEDLLARYGTWVPRRGFVAKLRARYLPHSRLRPGDFIQVRSRPEIEATLDAKKTLAGLPFMPEMELFCGGFFQVHRRVDYVNDMRNKTGLRRIRDVVTLTAVRCSGHAHDGCQAECQILWKDLWLRRLPDPLGLAEIKRSDDASAPTSGQLPELGGTDRKYFCQMTELWHATRPLPRIDVKQHLQPLICGNIDAKRFLIALLTRIFNGVQEWRRGVGYPHMPQHPIDGKATTASPRLNAGDPVVVRGKDEIARTLVNGRNRGLWFDRDMIRFCGRPAIVRRRVDRLIHEATGRMVRMKTPCLALEDVVATGEFLRLCPQHEYIFWREAWLRRSAVDSNADLAPD